MGGVLSSADAAADPGPRPPGAGGAAAAASPSALVVTGPSGVGKGTLIRRLLDSAPGNYAFSVSHTTRAPREGEEVSGRKRDG